MNVRTRLPERKVVQRGPYIRLLVFLTRFETLYTFSYTFGHPPSRGANID